jgi:hypothetical protein
MTKYRGEEAQHNSMTRTDSELPAYAWQLATFKKQKSQMKNKNHKKKWSERRDLNSRPPEPHSGALAKLRHAPTKLDETFS